MQKEDLVVSVLSIKGSRVKCSDFSAVKFTDLPHSIAVEDGFTKVSYGDAAWTLVDPQVLIHELEERQSSEYYFNFGLCQLIDELQAVKEAKLYIALEG